MGKLVDKTGKPLTDEVASIKRDPSGPIEYQSLGRQRVGGGMADYVGA